MNGYIKYADLMDTVSPCEEVACEECPFDGGEGGECKWSAFIDGLPRHEIEYTEGYKDALVNIINLILDMEEEPKES